MSANDSISLVAMADSLRSLLQREMLDSLVQMGARMGPVAVEVAGTTRALQFASEAQAQARNLLAGLAELRVEDIFEEGLHEFLSRFIGESAVLGNAMRESYLSGDMR